MRALLFFLFSFITVQGALASGSSLYLQPRVGYQAPRIFQNSQTSSYPGMSYGAAIYYKFSSFKNDDDIFGDTMQVALAPVISYHRGVFSNSANNSLQQETLTESTISAGIKVYLGQFFIQGQYSITTLKDVATGTKSLAIEDSNAGPSVAIGIEIPIVSGLDIELSGEANSATFTPKAGGFNSSSTQYLRIGGFFGLSIFLPSGEGKQSFRETKKTPKIR